MTDPEPDKSSQSSSASRKIVFFLELPNPISIANGSTFFFQLTDLVPELRGISMRATNWVPPYPEEMSGRMFVSFRFWQVEYQHAVMFEPLFEAMRRGLPVGLHSHRDNAAQPSVDSYRTVVEAVTLIHASNPDTESLSRAFDRCLVSLDELRLAYQAAIGVGIQQINRLHLPFIVPYATSDLMSEKWDETISWFFIHPNPPATPPRSPLSTEEMKILQVVLGRLRKGDPLVLYAERVAEARHSLHHGGDYASAVVEAQTAFEILMDAVLTFMLWEEGVSPEETAHTYFEDGLAQRIRKYYHPRLGGNWDTGREGIIGTWAHTVAPLRGRVVHAGYRPTFREAQDALETVYRVDQFVKERLVQKRNQYKRT